MPEELVPAGVVEDLLDIDVPKDIITDLPIHVVRWLHVISVTQSNALQCIVFNMPMDEIKHMPEKTGFCVYICVYRIAGGRVIDDEEEEEDEDEL